MLKSLNNRSGHKIWKNSSSNIWKRLKQISGIGMQIMNLGKTEIIIIQKLTVGFEKNLKSSVYIKLE